MRNSLTSLKIPGTSVAHQVARAVIRLNRAVTAFFVARYCASWSRQARALNRDVYLKAHEMARLSLCGDVSVPADSNDSDILFLSISREMLIICRGVADLKNRKLISLSIMQLYMYNGDQKDNPTQCVDVETRRSNQESVRSTGTMPRLTFIISLLTINIARYHA